MGSEHVSQAINSRGVEADITWGTGPEVRVTITGNAGYGSRAQWRIRGKNPDTTQYYPPPDEGHSTDEEEATFYAEDGKTYMFQAVWNDTSNGDDFIVNFGNDSGGDSGGGGGGDNNEADSFYYLWVIRNEGVNITVNRVYSKYGYIGTLRNPISDENEHGLWYGYKIWYNDAFVIDIQALNGYQLNTDSVQFGNLDYFEGLGEWEFYSNEDAWVSASATKIGSGGDGGGSGGGSSDGNTGGNNNKADLSAGFTNPNDGITIIASTRATWDENLKVTIGTVTYSTYNVSCKWRIKVQGTSNYVAGTDYGNTFIADEGVTYIFQGCVEGPYGDWGNSLDGSSHFTVSYNSGGNSSGGNTGGSTGTGETVTASGVTAKVTWTIDGKTTVTITSLGGHNAGLLWRVKIAGVLGNNGIQIPDTDSTSGSFNATDGETYIFQVCPNGTWTNDGGNASKFTVDFSSGSGSSGGSGGGSSTVESYRIYIEKGTGIKNLIVERVWSENGSTGQLSNYNNIWQNDYFKITVEPLDGYVLDTYTINGQNAGFNANNLYCYDIENNIWTLAWSGDVYISASATASSTVHIYDGYEFSPYSCYIYNGVGWDLYTPFVYNGVEWDRYS